MWPFGPTVWPIIRRKPSWVGHEMGGWVVGFRVAGGPCNVQKLRDESAAGCARTRSRNIMSVLILEVPPWRHDVGPKQSRSPLLSNWRH